jgi:hypothetical protein
MTILYISKRLPFPPKRGGKIRPFNMLRHLSASGWGHGLRGAVGRASLRAPVGIDGAAEHRPRDPGHDSRARGDGRAGGH